MLRAFGHPVAKCKPSQRIIKYFNWSEQFRNPEKLILYTKSYISSLRKSQFTKSQLTKSILRKASLRKANLLSSLSSSIFPEKVLLKKLKGAA